MFSKPLSPSTKPKTNTSHFESGSQLEVIQLEWLFFSAFNIITYYNMKRSFLSFKMKAMRFKVNL